MTTDIKEAARASARISDGDEFPEPHMGPNTIVFFHEDGFDDPRERPQLRTVAEKIRSLEPVEFMRPLQSRLTLDELQQRPMPWTGLTIAAAIVLACAWVALLVHAAGVHGWLR
jgi:hypothetical protein